MEEMWDDLKLHQPMTSPISPLPPSPFMLPPSPDFSPPSTAENQQLSTPSSPLFKFPLPPCQLTSSFIKKRRRATLSSFASSSSPSSPSISSTPSKLMLATSSLQSTFSRNGTHTSSVASFNSLPTLTFSSPTFPSTFSPLLSTPPPQLSPETSLVTEDLSFLPQTSLEEDSIKLITECLRNHKASLPSSSNIATITPTINRFVTRMTINSDVVSSSQTDVQASGFSTTITTSTPLRLSTSCSNQISQPIFTSSSRPKLSKILRKQKKFRKCKEKKSAFAAIFTHQDTSDFKSTFQMNPNMSSSLATVLTRYQEFLPVENDNISSRVDDTQFCQNFLSENVPSFPAQQPLLSSLTTSSSKASSSPPVDLLSNWLSQTPLLSSDILVALKQRQLILQMQQQLKKAEQSLKNVIQDQTLQVDTRTSSSNTKPCPTSSTSCNNEGTSLNNFLNNFLSTAIDVGKCDAKFLSLLNETLTKTLQNNNKPVVDSCSKEPRSSSSYVDTVQVNVSFQQNKAYHEKDVLNPTTNNHNLISSACSSFHQLSSRTSSCLSSCPAIVSPVHPVISSTKQNIFTIQQPLFTDTYDERLDQNNNSVELPLTSKTANTQQKPAAKKQCKRIDDNFLNCTPISNTNNDSIFTFSDTSSFHNTSLICTTSSEVIIKVSQPLITSVTVSQMANQKPIFRIVNGNKSNKNLKRHRSRSQAKNKKGLDFVVPTAKTSAAEVINRLSNNLIASNFSGSQHSIPTMTASQDIHNNLLPSNPSNIVGVNSLSSLAFPQTQAVSTHSSNIPKVSNSLINRNNLSSQNLNVTFSKEFMSSNSPYKLNNLQTKINSSLEQINVEQALLNVALSRLAPSQTENQKQHFKEPGDFLFTGSNLFNVSQQMNEVSSPQNQTNATPFNGKRFKLPFPGSLSDITEPLRSKTQNQIQNCMMSNNIVDSTNILSHHGLNELLHKQEIVSNQQANRNNGQLISEIIQYSNSANQYPLEIIPQYNRKLFKRISTTKENVKVIQHDSGILSSSLLDSPGDLQNLNAFDKHPTKNMEILNYITSILNIFGSNKPNEVSSACDLAVNQPLLFLKIYQQLSSELSSTNLQNSSKLVSNAFLTGNASLTNVSSNSKSKILRLPKTEAKKETLVCGSKILRMSVTSYPFTLTTSVLTSSIPVQQKNTTSTSSNHLPLLQVPQILPSAFASPTQTIHQSKPQNPPPSPPSPVPNGLNDRSKDVIPPNVVLTMSSLTGARLDEIVRTSLTMNTNGRPSIVIPNLYKKKKTSAHKRSSDSTQVLPEQMTCETQQFLSFSKTTSINNSDVFSVQSTSILPSATYVLPSKRFAQLSASSTDLNILDPSIFFNISSTEPTFVTLESLNPCFAESCPNTSLVSEVAALSNKMEPIDNALLLQSYNASLQESSGDSILHENEAFAIQVKDLPDLNVANEYLIRLQNEKTAKLMELISLQEKLLETSKLTEIKCELLRKETMEANERLIKSRRLALSSGLHQIEEGVQHSQDETNCETEMKKLSSAKSNDIQMSSCNLKTSMILQTSSASLRNKILSQNHQAHIGDAFSSNFTIETNANQSKGTNNLSKKDSSSFKDNLDKNSKDCFLFSAQKISCKNGHNQFEGENLKAESQSINNFSSLSGFSQADDEFPISDSSNLMSQETPMDHQQLNRQLHQFFPDLYHFDSPENDLSDFKRNEKLVTDSSLYKRDNSSKTAEGIEARVGSETKVSGQNLEVENSNKISDGKISNVSQAAQTKQGITSEEDFREKLVELLDFVQNYSSASPQDDSNDKSVESLLPQTLQDKEDNSSFNLPTSETVDSDVDDLLNFISRSNHESNENTSMDMDDYASFLSSTQNFSVSSLADSTTCLESPTNFDRLSLQLSSEMAGCQSHSENSSSGFGSVQSCFNRIEMAPSSACIEASYDQGFTTDGLLENAEDRRTDENHGDFGFSHSSSWFKASENELLNNRTNTQLMENNSSETPMINESTRKSCNQSYHHLELTPISPEEFPRKDSYQVEMDQRVVTFGAELGCPPLADLNAGVDDDDEDFIIRDFFDQSLMF